MPLSGEYAPSTARRARTQAEKYEATGGAEDNTIIGLPVVVLTSIGARTGKMRKTPLMRVEHAGEYLAVGSLGGAEKNPVWVYNLRANPLVELQDGSEKHDYHARELDGDERAVWWERAVEAFPNYAGYQRKTSRTIPVFLLTGRRPPDRRRSRPARQTGLRRTCVVPIRSTVRQPHRS